jgi:hypothetical protein
VDEAVCGLTAVTDWATHGQGIFAYCPVDGFSPLFPLSRVLRAVVGGK